MKVALVISSLSTGGAERVLSSLASYWAARGEEVTVITIDSDATDAYPLDSRVRRLALGMRADSRGLVRALVNNARRINALRAAIKSTAADAVVAFGEFTNVLVLIATRASKLRCIVSERTDPRHHRVGITWRVLRRLTYPFADALVVQTSALLPWARSVAGSTRVRAIPNPARDMRRFGSFANCARAHIVVACGRLVPVKGFDVLLEAFAQLPSELGHWK